MSLSNGRDIVNSLRLIFQDIYFRWLRFLFCHALILKLDILNSLKTCSVEIQPSRIATTAGEETRGAKIRSEALVFSAGYTKCSCRIRKNKKNLYHTYQ